MFWSCSEDVLMLYYHLRVVLLGDKQYYVFYYWGNEQSYVLFDFVALRPMSTAMVIAGRSVHLSTLFPGQA